MKKMSLTVISFLSVLFFGFYSKATPPRRECTENRYIVTINANNSSTKDGVISAWRIVNYDYNLERHVISSPTGTMGYAFGIDVRYPNAITTLNESLLKLAEIPGVEVQCDYTVHPLPGVTGSN